MPHGAPDWSNVVKEKVVHRLDDMAELACRLESIVRYDRRGDVFFLDSFDYGLPGWGRDISGTGAEVSVSVKTCRSRGYSCMLKAGLDSLLYARLRRHFPIIEPGKLGVEFSFALSPLTDRIQMDFIVFRGGLQLWFGLWYSPVGKTVEVYTDGIWKVIASDISLEVKDIFFHTMKLVMNTETGYYVRALLNNMVWAIEDIKASTAPTTEEDELRLLITNRGSVGANAEAFIDDIILTQNEP